MIRAIRGAAFGVLAARICGAGFWIEGVAVFVIGFTVGLGFYDAEEGRKR